MNDLKDLKPDELLTLMESMQDQLEKQHTQLETLRTENYKALKTVSDLSSENSMLRSELQKKSDTIVSQNKKLKDQAIIEADLVKSEEAKRAGEKAEREAERIRAILEGREAQLDEREAEIKRKEGDLVAEIETEAMKRVFDVRYKLNEEHKRKEEHIWEMSRLREQATADKYKKLTVRYQVEFTILLFYGVIVTALQVIAERDSLLDTIPPPPPVGFNIAGAFGLFFIFIALIPIIIGCILLFVAYRMKKK